jgi:hypothetical protein
MRRSLALALWRLRDKVHREVFFDSVRVPALDAAVGQ